MYTHFPFITHVCVHFDNFISFSFFFFLIDFGLIFFGLWFTNWFTASIFSTCKRHWNASFIWLVRSPHLLYGINSLLVPTVKGLCPLSLIIEMVKTYTYSHITKTFILASETNIVTVLGYYSSACHNSSRISAYFLKMIFTTGSSHQLPLSLLPPS